MAGTSIDLSFLNSSGANLSLTIAQLQAMDAELQKISERSPALIGLSRAFGITYAEAAKLTKELGVGPAKLQEAVGTMKQLRAAGADAVTQYSVLAKQLGLTVDQMKLVANTVDDVGSSLDDLGDKQNVVGDLRTALGGLFVIDKVNEFKNAILETGKTLETLETRLLTTLGTKAASDSALASIQKFAATTPFEMTEVTDSFLKLKQRGIEPTDVSLRKLGDLASSQGKSLNQTTEALLDAQQGEFERLKEFGIKASAAGDKVNLSFQGMNKQIERTPEGIAAGILSLGDLQGIAGGMELQSKTLGGALSNLTDAQSQLAGETFKLVQGPAIALVQTATKLIDSFSKLNPNVKLAILGVGTLGGIFTSAVAAIAAFQAANIGASLSLAYTTLLKGPAAIATAFNTAVTKLATIAEYDLAQSKLGAAVSTARGIPVTVADTGAKLANAAATKAQSAAMNPFATVTTTAGKASAAAGASAGLLAAALAGVVATGALLVNTFQTINSGWDASVAGADDVALSLKALTEAEEKSAKNKEGLAKATKDAAEASRVAGLTNEQRAAESIAKEGEITAAYDKNVQDRIGFVGQFMDKIREFIDLPKDTLVKTFKLVAQLPLPGSVKDFFKGIGDQIEKTKLASQNMLTKDKDKEGFANTLQVSDQISARKNSLKATSGGSLGNATKAEVEAISSAYDKNIKTIQDVVPADAAQKSQKQAFLKSLEKENEEVKQSLKLIQEKEKRVTSVGTAETQWASEIKKVNVNMGKQIATSEDAGKATELIKKQLENGFINPEQAAAAFQEIAAYTQATGDIQVAARKEAVAAQAKAYDNEKVLLESRIQLAELDGLTQVTNAEGTATKVAGIKKEQADVEFKSQQDKLDLLKSLNLDKGTEGLATEKALSKAKIDVAKAEAEEKLAQQKEAIAKINKAIQDGADARQSAESKASIKVKGAALEAIKDREVSFEKADKRVSDAAEDRARVALDQEIALKITKQKELANVGGKEATEAAKKLGLDILQLQDKAASLEIAQLKRLQERKLEVIRENAEKTKALLELTNATNDNAQAVKDLEAYRQLSNERTDIDIKTAALEASSNKSRLESTAAKLEAELESIETEAAATAALNLDRETTEKNRIAFATKSEAKLADISRNALDQFKAGQAEKKRILDLAVKETADRIKNASDEIKNIFASEQEVLTQINSLASAQNALEDARNKGRDIALNGRKQELVLAKEAADATGNKGVSEKLGQKIKELELNVLRAQADEIKRQYDLKLSTLELDIKSKEIAAEQLILEKEMALLESKSQLEAGKAEGKSALELQSLSQKVNFAEKALVLANKGKDNTAKIADLQRNALTIERGNALQSNAQQVRAGEVRYGIEFQKQIPNGKQNLNNIANRGLGISTAAEKALEVADPAKVPESAGKSITAAKAILDNVSKEGANKPLPKREDSVYVPKLDDPWVKMFGLKFDQLDKTLQQSILEKQKETPDKSAKGAPSSGARASGGPVDAGGSYLVGELGPELVTFAQQSYVHTATNTKQMLAAMGQVTPAVSGQNDTKLIAQLQRLNDQVAEGKRQQPINVPVNVTTNDANAVSQALAIIRADRAARHNML